MSLLKDTTGGDSLLQIALPGSVGVIAIHPAAQTWIAPLADERFGIDSLVLISVEILIVGLLFHLSSSPIIRVYEGFKWPRLTSWAKRYLDQRILECQARLAKMSPSGNDDPETILAQQLISDSLRDFPTRSNKKSGGTEWYADRPTLVGNIIATYELYPEQRYGFSGVWYWHHLLFLAPEPARKTFSSRIHLAESLVLASAAGILTAAIYMIFLTSLLLGTLASALNFRVVLMTCPVDLRESCLGVAAGLFAYAFFYRLALPAYRDAGSAFRALTDLAVSELSKWAESAEGLYAVNSILRRKADQIEQYLKFGQTIRNPHL